MAFRFFAASALLGASLLVPRALPAGQAQAQAPTKPAAVSEAQRKAQIKEIMHRAEAAHEDEDFDLARRLYLQVIDLDPESEETDPYYKLGDMSEDDEEALSWFKQYAELEPDDAWGWLAVGQKSLKLGKTREALAAMRKAADLEPDDEDIQDAFEEARTAAAPAFQPLGGYIVDSDEVHTYRFGLEGSAAIRGGFRLAARATRADLRGKLLRASLDEFLVRVEGRPWGALRLDFSAGLARSSAQGTGIAGRFKTNPVSAAEADLRIRWKVPVGGPSYELRLQRLPFMSVPALVVNQAMQDDAKLVVDLPVGPLRVRGTGRASLIETLREPSNRRLEAGAALVLPFGWRGEVSLQFHDLGFERATTAGYFAPRSVQTIEGGTSWELGGDGAWSAEFDVGLGIQRLAKQGEELGPWKFALRGWGYLALDIAPALQARLELEAYSAPFATATAAASENWKYLSAELGLLVRLR